MNCNELVELITDYLEGALSPETGARFEKHLGICPDCADYVNQLRVTLRLAGGAKDDRPLPRVPAALIRAFRDWTTDNQ